RSRRLSTLGGSTAGGAAHVLNARQLIPDRLAPGGSFAAADSVGHDRTTVHGRFRGTTRRVARHVRRSQHECIHRISRYTFGRSFPWVVVERRARSTRAAGTRGPGFPG